MTTSILPRWAIASMWLVPLSPLLGWLGAIVSATFVPKPHGVVTNYFGDVSRTGVLMIAATLAVGVAAAMISLARRERPTAVALLGLATNALTLVMFWQGQYALRGYDQDRGAVTGPGYRTVGEGLTAGTSGTMQAARSWPLAGCDTLAGVHALRGIAHAELRREQPFALVTLGVTAVDASGAVVPSVPITIDVEDTTPTIFYFFENRLAQGPTPHSAGLFHFRIRTRCAGTSVELKIPARSRPA